MLAGVLPVVPHAEVPPASLLAGAPNLADIGVLGSPPAGCVAVDFRAPNDRLAPESSDSESPPSSPVLSEPSSPVTVPVETDPAPTPPSAATSMGEVVVCACGSACWLQPEYLAEGGFAPIWHCLSAVSPAYVASYCGAVPFNVRSADVEHVSTSVATSDTGQVVGCIEQAAAPSMPPVAPPQFPPSSRHGVDTSRVSFLGLG